MSHCTNTITLSCQTLISAVCQYKNGMCSYSVIREDLSSRRKLWWYGKGYTRLHDAIFYKILMVENLSKMIEGWKK